jgi:hypothetical protein
VGFHGVLVGSRDFFLPLGCSFRLQGILGAEVNDAWDDSWSGSFTKWLYLAVKTSHMGGRCGHASLPSTLAYDSYLPGEGTRPIYQTLSLLVATVGGGAF